MTQVNLILAVAVTDYRQGQLEAKVSHAKPAEFSNSYKIEQLA